MRVAFLVDTVATDRAGTERQLLEILRRLDRRRFEPELIVMRESSWMRSNEMPCPTWDLGYRGFMSPGFPRVLGRYRRLLTTRGYDIVMTFLEESILLAGLGGIHLENSPALLSTRRDTGMPGEHPWYHSLFRALRPIINRRFRAIVANGAQVKDYTVDEERVDPQRVHVIPNGVETPLDSYPVPAPICHDGSAVWVGAVANLKPVKRIDLLIDAIQIHRDVPGSRPVKLLVLGEGKERSRLEARVSRAGLKDMVFLPGAVEDVQPYLAHLDIAVSSSAREGLSNAILEAMAAGLPLVATDVGESGELVKQANGFLVPSGDAIALADRIGRLVADAELRQRMGAASRQRAQTEFSWSVALRRYESLLTEAVEI